MITIIGAGPVGNYLAFLLSKQDKDVRVIEEHEQVGKPVQCTGIVTNEFAKIINLDKKFVLNKVKRAKIFSTKKSFIEFNLRKENLILNREKLDSCLHDKAKEQGVEYILGKRFEGNKGNKIKVGDVIMPTAYLIGADGPFSSVAKDNGLFEGRKFVVGSQARVKGEYESDLIEFFLGFGCFGWLVPEDEKIARVGVMAYKEPGLHLDRLLKKRVNENKIIDKQGGFVPLYNPKQKVKKGNVLLVGDAATQVKATTFGGLVPGLLAAEVMARDIDNYDNKVRKRLHKDLYMNLLLRRVMDRFSEKDYDDLVKLCMQDRVKQVLEEKDRDFPSRFLFEMLIKEPRLLKFSKKLVF